MRKKAIELIIDERRRQIDEEGYNALHDFKHHNRELEKAAQCYATPEHNRIYSGSAPVSWPWHASSWKPTPKNRIRELVKAGALYMASDARLGSNIWKYEIIRIAKEIERLQEASNKA